jgi:predicted NAD/FAD-dependent oxidoreductase
MRLVVVGAGISGLAAAHHLTTIAPHIDIHMYESNTAIGGRVATRSRDGAVFDHGAQFFRPVDDAQNTWFTQTLPSSALVDIAKPVHAFDRENRISTGDSTQNTLPKYTYSAGIATLADLLLPAGVTLSLQTTVGHVCALPSGGYAVVAADGSNLCHADAVLFTAPGPQTSAMVRASIIDEIVKKSLVAAFAPAVYRPCLSVSLLHAGVYDPDWYALVNTDRGHPISWLAVEHAKAASRVPAGHTLFTAQLAPAATRNYRDTAPAALAPVVDGWIRALTGHTLATPLWCDTHSWPAALPDGRADAGVVQAYEATHGLYFAGDAHTGQGRIQLALAHGRAVAGRIASHAGVSS